MDGYRLITTTYTYYQTLEDAKEAAVMGRMAGKRTEIIPEAIYRLKYMDKRMQDLTKLENKP